MEKTWLADIGWLEPGAGDVAEYVKKMHAATETLYRAIVQRLSDQSSYDPECKTYQLFRDDASMVMFLRFYVLYIRYYALSGDDNIQATRNRASEYLMASFLSTCTNNIKLKYYVRKSIEGMIRACGHDLDGVLEGYLPGDAVPPKAVEFPGHAVENDSAGTPVTSLDLLSNSKSVAAKIFQNESSNGN